MWSSTASFQDKRVKYFLKAITLHGPFKAKLKTVTDIDTLLLIAQVCDFTCMGQSFKALYTLAFFSFLRLSNFVPHTAVYYSPLHQLARADVIFAPPRVLLSKTIQARNAVKILTIPSLGDNPICLVKAIKNLLSITAGANNSPLFQYKTKMQWKPLTDNQVRRYFALILKNNTTAGLQFHI